MSLEIEIREAKKIKSKENMSDIFWDKNRNKTNVKKYI